jgi:hypothetical protein
MPPLELIRALSRASTAEIRPWAGAGTLHSRGTTHRFDNNGVRDVKTLCLNMSSAIGPHYFASPPR